MSKATATCPLQPIDRVTHMIQFALTMGATAIMALLMFLKVIPPMAVVIFAVVVASTGTWVASLIQKMRNRHA